MRASVRNTIGLVVAIAALVCGHSSGFAERQHPYLSAASVCIDVSVKDYLSGSAFTALRSEAARIWRRHGVALTWAHPLPVTCEIVVPVVFDEVKLRALAGPKRDVLALTEFAGASRRIYVSAPRAFDVVGQIRGRSSPHETIGERDYRQGTLIGRALAHELGHVLLNTVEHSAGGLMRPLFSVKDALSVDDRTTDLAPAEAQRLAARFSLIPAGDARARAVLAQRGR